MPKVKYWKFSYHFCIMAILSFMNWIVAAKTIEGGNYSREKTICGTVCIWLNVDFLLVHIWIIKTSFWSPNFVFPLYFCTWVWRNKSRRPRNFAWSVRQVLCHSIISANYRIYISELSLGFLIREAVDCKITDYI